MTKETLTPRDRELLTLLKRNAREPVAALGRKLGMSRTTVQDRMRRLEDSGIITGYGVRVAENMDAGGIRAIVTIEAEPRRAADVARAMARMPQIETLHTVSGKVDLIATARTASAEELDMLLDQLGLIQGITGTESSIILSTKFDRR